MGTSIQNGLRFFICLGKSNFYTEAKFSYYYPFWERFSQTFRVNRINNATVRDVKKYLNSWKKCYLV